MARMQPNLTEHELENLNSNAEGKFYHACRDQLPDKYLVSHSIKYIERKTGRATTDGEADFVIFDPDAGFTVVEIKGGGIDYQPDTDKWFTVNARNERFEIKDPFSQATGEKHNILRNIIDHHQWTSSNMGRILSGHAVFFPDISDLRPFYSPQRVPEIIGGRHELDNLQAWLDNVVEYWRHGDPRYNPIGTSGIRIIEDIFHRPFHVRPLVSSQIADEEIKRIYLTDQQTRILKALGNRKRVTICGGAGTGKTLLAMHKAKEFADNGLKTILLCFNRPLADHLADVAGNGPNLETMTFHQFCSQQVRAFRELHGRDFLEEAGRNNPGGNLYEDHMPEALANCSEDERLTYDAIIVDEGQDFKEEYWVALDMILREEGYLYIFYDKNQAIYQECPNFPVKEDPFLLTVNCRNTKHIHNAAYHYYRGERVDPPVIQGVEISIISGPGFMSQMKRMHSEIVNLIARQEVLPDDICVLVPGQSQEIYVEALTGKPLPQGIRWAFATHGEPNSVVVETVRRFKGLEKPIVFWAGLDEYDPETDFETAYVALSRAKSRLYLVGSEIKCQNILDFTLESLNG